MFLRRRILCSFPIKAMEKTKAEKMYALIVQWRASRQTQKVFCGEHDIKVGTFGWWVARKKRDDSLDSGFALVDMAGQPGSGKVEITYPNSVRISHGHPDMALIAQLIRLC